ncbi:MAG: hypothetical protein Q8P56_06155 [Candidatus Uhrbacteria bacterium]|nr:hypothetical protein [Candidatus Uhrbacteria bacterium]
MIDVKNTVRGLALDIDDTLAWTCREWVEHLHLKFGNPENLTPREFVEKYGLIQHAEYFKREEVYAHIRTMCVNPTLHESIAVIADALPALEKISSVIPIVAYLTARPESMRSITEPWLKRHGFPERELIMRPDELPLEDMPRWKAQALEQLYPKAIGIIDDNPSICTHLSKEYPGVIFLYNHSGDGVSHPAAQSCSDWNDVVQKVINYFESRNPTVSDNCP